MPDESYDILIVGAGPAGVTAALRARELGATVALVERGTLGGACTNDGCVPTRFLAHAARLIRNAVEYADYGLEGAPPTADLGRIMGQARGMVERIHQKKRLREHLEAAGVDVFDRVGPASFVDQETLSTPDGRAFRGRRILLCVGGHARRLPIPGGDLALTHSDVWSMERLPERLLIVGGAATGCQLASVFAAFGSRVTLADFAPRLAPAEDPDISEELGRAFRARGIDILLGAATRSIGKRDGGGRRVAIEIDGQMIERDADVVVAAVGWPGNLDDLNLGAAGVETERGYIVVDETLRTSAPHVYAAGDITGRMMLVQCASDEGIAATENALLATPRTHRHQVVPHGGFTDPEYGSVGLTEPQARDALDVVCAIVPYRELDRAVIDGRPEGFCKLIVDRATRRIVGAHVIGQQAVEIVQVAATAMQAGAVIDDVARLEYAYPTFTSAVGLAARQALRRMGEGPSSPHWRSIGESHAAEWEA